MKKEDIEFIINCLPQGRSKFYYFKDRYALMLLEYMIGKGKTIHELKASRFGRLLNKPMIKKVIKNSGNGRLTPGAIGSIWPRHHHCYLMTLGMWGDRGRWARLYNQTSRPGCNLVLQLNFSSRHNHIYERMLKPDVSHPFKCRSHPIATDGHHTLAWARLDIDLDRGEALIEEIQTDWIRMAVEGWEDMIAYEKRQNRKNRYTPWIARALAGSSTDLAHYLKATLKPHIRIWDEAMLASAICFLREEIGIEKIYYHTHSFGCRMKRIHGARPPRSLYTKLPERFCFTKQQDSPEILIQNKNRVLRNFIKNNHPEFYLLDFSAINQTTIHKKGQAHEIC